MHSQRELSLARLSGVGWGGGHALPTELCVTWQVVEKCAKTTAATVAAAAGARAAAFTGICFAEAQVCTTAGLLHPHSTHLHRPAVALVLWTPARDGSSG